MHDLVLVGASSVAARFQGNLIAYDTEGTGLIPYGPSGYWGYYPARPFAHSFCDEHGHQAWMRTTVDPRTRQVRPLPKGEDEALRHFLSSEKYIKVGHNISYDKRITEEAGYVWGGEIHDTMVMAHVVTAGDELSYALKPLSKKWLGFPDDDEKKLEDQVKSARQVARSRGYLIAGGKKEVERGDNVVFAGSKPVKADYWLVPTPRATSTTTTDLVRDYGVGDAERAMLMFLFFWPMLEADPRLMNTYRREMALFHVLRRMERRGTRVYPNQINHLIQWYRADMQRWQDVADTEGGWTTNAKNTRVRMNYNSSKQLQQKFYVERGHPIEYKERHAVDKETNEVRNIMTPTFGKDQLATLGAVDDETGKPKDMLAKCILEYRSGKQTITSFLNIYQKFFYPVGVIDPRHKARYDKILAWKGRLRRVRERDLAWLVRYAVWVLHPNYNQCGAVTGRMSCGEPNLQQVASSTTGLRKSEIMQRPRECFGPLPGHVWYMPDFSQIEVWLFAFMSEEAEMMRLLLSGYDFHQGVADKSFVKKPDYQARKKYYRKMAKLILFGKLFGGGVGTPENPGRMTRLLQMPFEQAKEFIESFEDQFATVKHYMRQLVLAAKYEKEAWNLFGRKYLLSYNWAYKVVNYRVQGSAADVLKLATMRVDWMLDTRWKFRGGVRYPTLGLTNTIHDELIIQVPDALDCLQLQREIMWVMQMDSTHCGIPVPLPVSMKVTKPLYNFREHEWVQRWSDTADVKVRSDKDVAYWKAKGRVGGRPDPSEEEIEKFGTILGCVPYRRHEREEFADLAVHMQCCPYNDLVCGPDPA